MTQEIDYLWISSRPAQGDTYRRGETIEVGVWFTREVELSASGLNTILGYL